MKLVRFGPVGMERPGMIDEQGRLRDLSAVVGDIEGRTIGPEALDRLRALDVSGLPVIDDAVRLGVPVANVGKIVAIGLNYTDHAKEAGRPIPEEPVVFMKATTSLCGAYDDTIKPRQSIKLDWEVELGIVIGTLARSVSESQALSHVAGYCLVNDVSERHFQNERGGTWDKGKSFDTFCPVGPWLVTPDEIGDPQNLAMRLDVNGKRMQTGSTANMIFACATLIRYVSEVMTLMPGDILITGTPPGVGLGMKPPVFLHVGDVVTLGIDGLGEQRQTIVADTRGA
ncbi:fumarylacetoacetate hydrolase family protein [Pararobbsia silviterrae]|uniref:FAA hydrolase family protein n=1 Tax=Pararobbsia silviterrae TaxID=1792498 RepID=A0A494Y9H4_9BURK|nr:fumarylacetoacetate hydrolase family protein [Pararobbsia silviterrae]RKP59284.1 FAA hydrolase family protein [Pararobbsia silviterrae]